MTGEVNDLHRSPSIIPLFLPALSFLQATEQKGEKKQSGEPFCVNSLIRKTSASIVPLHFGGKKYFIDFFLFFLQSNRRREELRKRLCVGLDSAGGLQGWEGGEMARCCERARVLAMERNAGSALDPSLPSERTNIAPCVCQLLNDHPTQTQRDSSRNHQVISRWVWCLL